MTMMMMMMMMIMMMMMMLLRPRPGIIPVKTITKIVQKPEKANQVVVNASGIEMHVTGYEHKKHVCEKSKHIVKHIIKGEAIHTLVFMCFLTNNATAECPSKLDHGLKQGCVLAPTSFTLFLAALLSTVSKHPLCRSFHPH